MEKPNYGRTGLLASRLSGLPVTQPRLLSSTLASQSTTSRSLKWYPSLLTIPQQLLDALRHEEEEDEDANSHVGTSASTTHVFSADPTLATYLRVATIAECLVQRWRRSHSAAAHADSAGSSSSGGGMPSRAQVAWLYANVLEWSREKVKAETAASSSSARRGAVFVPAYKLLVMKDDKRVMEYANITWRSVCLLGREPVVNDVLLEHPSCSAQQAALEMRFVLVDEASLNDYLDKHAESRPTSQTAVPSYTVNADKLRALCEEMWAVLVDQQESAGGDPSAVWTAELQLTDLGSTNRTKLNGEVLPAMEATTVIDSDVLEFGCSTRKYVVLRNA